MSLLVLFCECNSDASSLYFDVFHYQLLPSREVGINAKQERKIMHIHMGHP